MSKATIARTRHAVSAILVLGAGACSTIPPYDANATSAGSTALTAAQHESMARDAATRAVEARQEAARFAEWAVQDRRTYDLMTQGRPYKNSIFSMAAQWEMRSMSEARSAEEGERDAQMHARLAREASTALSAR